jgi:hypothetical protein
MSLPGGLLSHLKEDSVPYNNNRRVKHRKCHLSGNTLYTFLISEIARALGSFAILLCAC